MINYMNVLRLRVSSSVGGVRYSRWQCLFSSYVGAGGRARRALNRHLATVARPQFTRSAVLWTRCNVTNTQLSVISAINAI